MSIEGQAQLRCSCSFRSATDYRSPINGLSEINRFELFYKHCIPTGFPDRLALGGLGEGLATKTKILLSPFLLAADRKKDREIFLFLLLSYTLTPTLSQRERALPTKSWHAEARQSLAPSEHFSL